MVATAPNTLAFSRNGHNENMNIIIPSKALPAAVADLTPPHTVEG